MKKKLLVDFIFLTQQKRRSRWVVTAVGPGRLDAAGKRVPMTLTVGEKVYFDKYAGTDTGDGYIIIKEEDILGSF